MMISIKKDQNQSKSNTMDETSKGETIVRFEMFSSNAPEQKYHNVYLASKKDDEPLTEIQKQKIERIRKNLENNDYSEFIEFKKQKNP